MSRTQTAAVLRDNAEDLKTHLAPHLAAAGAKTRDVVAPTLATAGAKTRDVVVDEVLPRVKDGIAATAPVRAEAARRGSAALHALAGHVDPPTKSRHLGRKAVLVTLIGAGAAAAWRAWKLPHDSDDWMHADAAAPPKEQAKQPATAAPPSHV
ncbi:MAG TPA: DUF5324 family protein [Sporichthyaceae bacterium]|nr:DUF5324 family protein [Sporichthyaceae bacterium]